eukprot:765757-Hanusia_phi.AAC.3
MGEKGGRKTRTEREKGRDGLHSPLWTEAHEMLCGVKNIDRSSWHSVLFYLPTSSDDIKYNTSQTSYHRITHNYIHTQLGKTTPPNRHLMTSKTTPPQHHLITCKSNNTFT